MKNFFKTIIALLGIGAAQADPASAQANLDFSHVTSIEIAQALEKEGKLFPILLFPAEFGGEAIPANIVYVPAGIPEIKDQMTGTLIRFFEEGLIEKLTVNPEYKGKSFVPSRIKLKATHSSKSGTFEPVIEIW